MESLAEKLTEIYLKKETWHTSKLSKEDADLYHRTLLMMGQIFTYVSDNELIGYLEVWRINREQLSRLVLNEKVYALGEDISTGEIAYINNMWISPDERGGHVFNTLSNLFLEKHKDANFFIAFRSTKHNKPMQVYKRDELIRLYKEK